MSKINKPQNGYALLVGVLLLTFVLVLVLSITSQVIRQVKASTRSANSIQALASADSGLEKAFFLDRDADSGVSSFDATGYAPFTSQNELWYRVTRVAGSPKLIYVKGYAYGTTRSIDATY
jgi:hypothetical protein